MSQYGIFCGCFGDDDAMWLESVEELEAAYKRMNEIASQRPGKYFIFSPHTKEAVASVDTTKQK